MARKQKSRQQKKKHDFVWKGDFRVYILRCKGGSYYTGHTHDLPARLALHRSGKGSKYVRSHLPFTLVYEQACRCFKLAYAEELRIKALARIGKDKLVKEFQAARRKKRGLRVKG